MYEPSRSFLNTHLAGFAHYDGLDVIDELKVGTTLELRLEPDNPHDPRAVAVYFGETKLGFIPKHENGTLHQFMTLGHEKLFEVRINRMNLEVDPEMQIGLAIKIRDVRPRPDDGRGVIIDETIDGDPEQQDVEKEPEQKINISVTISEDVAGSFGTVEI